MLNLFLVFQFITSFLLILVILLQRSSSDSITGIGSEFSNMSFMSGRSAYKFIHKTTIGLIIIFFVLSLTIANLSSKQNKLIYKQIESLPSEKELELPVKN